MNYYEKMLKNVSKLIDESPEEALRIIDEELKVPYVPSDILKQLNELKNRIDIDDSKDFTISVDTIKEYLKSDESKQYVAVEELSKLNLREYEDLCSDFLLSNGSLRAKVILMLSMKQQDISKEYSILKENKIYQFIPKDIVLQDDCEYYKKCKKLLNDHYMKNPDKLNLSYELLYNDYLFNLPETRNILDSKKVADGIITYIENSFK